MNRTVMEDMSTGVIERAAKSVRRFSRSAKDADYLLDLLGIDVATSSLTFSPVGPLDEFDPIPRVNNRPIKYQTPAR